MDIYILVESCQDMAAVDKIKKLHEKYTQSLLKKKKAELKNFKPTHDYILLDDIKSCLNGFARIVYYKATNGTPEESLQNELISVEEGQFSEGLKSGYCRLISAIDGSCAAGFHIKGIPNGKWTMYKSNGEFALPQGLYEGSNCTQKIEIANFNDRILKPVQ
mmetsp:Transcript_6802/g.11453  ORF Transcript_6802/g.11453 Transcript_6802/m.11453 type:complete len:162 (-) Transcript_6802:112-597(-)